MQSVMMSGDGGDFAVAAVIVLCLVTLAYSFLKLGEAMRGNR